MLLAIDSSTQFMGIALFDGAQVSYEKVWKTNRRHTVELSPAIVSALTESGSDKSTLHCVAVATGPGSFTSLRIGLAAAKGLSFALKIPVIGIPSLEITAYGQPPAEERLICVLKVGRGRYAAQDFDWFENSWKPNGGIYATTAVDLESQMNTPTIIRGEITAEDRKTLERRWRNALVARPSDNIRRPSFLAEIAWKEFQSGRADDVIALEPIYLKTTGTPD